MMMCVLVVLRDLLKTLISVCLVLVSDTVIIMFPLVVRLLVPIMTGVLCVCMRVSVGLSVLKIVQLVAGTWRWVRKLPVKVPEFLSRVVVWCGLKTCRFVVLKVLMMFVISGVLGLIMARLIVL